MIVEEKLYGVVCDGCDEVFENPDSGISYRPDNECIKADAEEYGWHFTEEGKCYCCLCHSFDKKGELIIKS